MLRPLRELLISLAWLEPFLELARTAAFLGFLLLGLLAARAWSRGRGARRWTNALLIYSLAVTFAVGLVQVESWPFSNWALVWSRAPERVRSWDVEAIDAHGRAWRIDMRVVQPLGIEDFGAWFFSRFPELHDAGRDEVSRFVLARAEHHRGRFHSGDRRFSNESILGSLAAPHHFLHRPVWSGPGDVSEAAYRRIRWWRLEWDVAERMQDPDAVTRELIYEWPHE